MATSAGPTQPLAKQKNRNGWPKHIHWTAAEDREDRCEMKKGRAQRTAAKLVEYKGNFGRRAIAEGAKRMVPTLMPGGAKWRMVI